MKKHTLLSLLSGLVLLISNSCMKKELEIEIIESDCKKFKISSATYNTLADPSCTGSPLTASYDITFSYDGDDKCLYKIVLEPEILDANSDVISNVSFPTEILTSDESLVTINSSSKKITFRFEFTFANSTDANNYNHAFITFHTENEQGNPSKDAQVRMNGNCSSPGDYTVKNTVNVTGSSINVKLWDDGAEDGDIISVYLNGVWVLENYSLTNAGQTFNWPITDGSNNDIVIVANNQGTVGPNTCAISINGGSDINLSLDLKTGQAVRVK